MSKSGLFSLMGAFSGNVLARAAIEVWGMSKNGAINPAVAESEVDFAAEEIWTAEPLDAAISDTDLQSDIHEAAPIATAAHDSMSFDEAFAVAREELGPGGVFDWQGQVYGTWYKEEWDAMGNDDREAYWASIEHEAASYHEAQSPAANEDHSIWDSLVLDSGNVTATSADDLPDAVVAEALPDAALGSAPEPVIIPLDLDGDDVFEAIGMDENHDGKIEVVLTDTNHNQVPDMMMLDTNNDGILDASMFDSNEDGTFDTASPMAQEMQLEIGMEDAAEPEEIELSVDDNPDFDNDADMSDWV